MTSRPNRDAFLHQSMRDEHAFCPKSGAPLSERPHYDGRGRPWHVPEPERPDAPLGAGERIESAELTNGEFRSSRLALTTYFRRCQRRHGGSDDRLCREAGSALRRLKRATTRETEWDLVVWYALGERLTRDGHDVAWMHAHTKPRCLDCGGRLKYHAVAERIVAVCATNCSGDRRDQLAALRSRVATLYTDAYPETPLDENELELLD